MMVQIQFKEHLRIIGVVHVVVDGVDTRGRASIASGRAARRGRRLSGGIADGVSGARATALEGVVESNPVADHMDQVLRRCI